jgi:cold shock protein
MIAAVVDSSRTDRGARDEFAFGKRSREMPTGTIKKLVSDRGFGFIAAEDGREYFFHRTGLDSSVNFDSLAGGERVEFEMRSARRDRGQTESSWRSLQSLRLLSSNR